MNRKNYSKKWQNIILQPIYFFALLLLCTAITIVLHPKISIAAEKTTTQWVEEIQNCYANIKSMRGFFKQTTTHIETGIVEDRQGELNFKRPFLFHWESKPPFSELLLVNTESIWNYFPDEELAYKFSLTMLDDQNAFVNIITGQSRLDKNFEIKVLGIENKLSKFKLLPYEPTQSMVEATIWVEPQTGMIKQFLFVDYYGNKNEVRFEKYELNVNIPDNMFKFTPPKGTDIEDMTKNSPISERISQ